MKEEIKSLLEDALPLVDFNSEFVFAELDSLGITVLLMLLSEHYHIQLDRRDATPKNLKNPDSIVRMVENKMAGRQ